MYTVRLQYFSSIYEQRRIAVNIVLALRIFKTYINEITQNFEKK